MDDFSNAAQTPAGIPRLVIDDQQLGSHSQAKQSCADGVLQVRGDLVPGRGVPAFISIPLPLSADNRPHDLSAYQGVRLRVKIKKGNLCVQVASAEIQNYDYHTSAPIARSGDEFQEVRIPFTQLRRAWSEPIPLNLKTITSVNLVSISMAKDSFMYHVDEVGFY